MTLSGRHHLIGKEGEKEHNRKLSQQKGGECKLPT